MDYRIKTEKTWAQTYRDLNTEFQRWARFRGRGIKWDVVNMRGQAPVTLTYQHEGEAAVTLMLDRQGRAEDNLRALYLGIESLRLNELRGIADIVRAAYLALPAPTVERDPYEVLGVRSDSPRVVIDGAFRALSKAYHPDNGTEPNPAAMAELSAAYERIKGEAK